MNVSLQGNPRISAMPGEAGLPPVDGAPSRETASHAATNLTVTVAPASTKAENIPPAEIEKAIVRDDALGKLVDRALEMEFHGF